MAVNQTDGRRVLASGGGNADDALLISQVEQGSEDALVALHRRYVNLVFSLTLRILGDLMAAEEVTQDVFIKLWQHPRAYDPAKGRFSSWLLTMARHAAIDRLRKDGRQPWLVSTSDGKDQHTSRGQMIPMANLGPHEHEDLRLAVGQLPSDRRQLIELAYFQGMSQQDIAVYLDLPLGTVKTRMRLGMQQLRAICR